MGRKKDDDVNVVAVLAGLVMFGIIVGGILGVWVMVALNQDVHSQAKLGACLSAGYNSVQLSEYGTNETFDYCYNREPELNFPVWDGANKLVMEDGRYVVKRKNVIKETIEWG